MASQGGDFVEAIKLFGGIAGLATAAFTIWDRLARGRPLAYVTLKGSPGNPYQYVRVKNVDRMDILITAIRPSPSRFRISKGHSLRAIVGAAMGERPAAILAPEQEHDFPVIIKSDEPASTIWFFISWRRASVTWMPLPPKVISTSTRDLALMAQALKDHGE
jgi:hypothetical protein